MIPFIPSLDDINLGLESMHFSQKPPRGAASRESQDRYSVTSASTSSSVVPSPSPGADGAMEIKGRGAGHTASVYSVDSIYSDPSATGRVGGVGAEAEWNTTHSRQASSASGRPSLSGSGRRSSAGAGVDTRRTSGVSSVLDQYGGERWASDDGASGSLPYDDHYRDVPQDIQTPLASSMYSASAASSMYGGGSDYFASSSPGPGHAQAQQQQQQQQPYQQHVQPQYYSDGTPYYSEDPRHRPVPSQQFASYGGTSSLPQQAYHQQQQQQAPSFQPQPMHGGWSYEQAGAAIAQNPYYAAATGQLGFPGEPALHRAPSSASSMSMGPAASLNRSQSSLHVPGGGATAAPGIRRKPTSGSTGSGHSTSSGPPITKQSVDDYRQRIKADPDPEAQFNFAKYLIEAAKKITTSASGDEKHAKKYRDALLAESLKLIKRLATQSTVGKPAYADAQFFLANCLGNGSLGLQVDHEKAYNLYVQASKQNHSSATYRTAVCNEVGAGTRRDHPRAVLFYRKASALGDTAGMYKLGMILLNGLLGQQRNPREAVAWLRRAASQADEDNPHALHELGLLYEKPPPPNGGPTLVPYDPAQARELFTQAGQFGYPPSQFKLGSCYEYGSLTCPVDPRRSIAWYTRAAERGDAESELALSGWYLTGSEGVLKQSDSEAYLWARRAANKGLPKAEYAVGYYSEVGIGVKQDLEEAKRWYMRSAGEFSRRRRRRAAGGGRRRRGFRITVMCTRADNYAPPFLTCVTAQGNKRAMQRLTELKKLGAEKGRGAKKSTARPTRQEAATECVVS